MAIDRYESTFVVDINGNGDFTEFATARLTRCRAPVGKFS